MAKYDINGYVLIETSNISSYGADPANNDNYTEIQAAIDSNYRMVTIGDSVDSIFYVSKPLEFKSNKTYIINGSIKTTNGIKTLLTSDISIGATIIPVTSVVGFSVGQSIIVSEIGEVSEGVLGSSSKILSIDGNNITIDEPTTYASLVANGAFMVTSNSVFLTENKEYIKILGSGLIDANRENQFKAYPLRYGGGEDTRAQCAMSFFTCSDIVIEGKNLQFIGGWLHGLSVYTLPPYYNNRIDVSGVNCHHAYYKNMLSGRTKIISVTDSEFNDSEIEDGLIFYVTNTDVYVNNIIAKRNARAGFTWNSESNDRLTGGNITTEGNGFKVGLNAGVVITSKGAVLDTIDCKDSMSIQRSYDCRDNTFNNVTIHDSEDDILLNIAGNVKNITFNNLIIRNCIGTGINVYKDFGVPKELCENVIINGGGIYNHTGTKTEIEEGSDITYDNFEI